MGKDATAVIATSDTDAAAWLCAEGLLFLHVTATEKRAVFTFRAPRRTTGESLLFAFYRNHGLRELLAARKRLRRAVDLARAAPSRTCTAGDLAAELAAWVSAQERQHESTRSE